jgi:hypothetical protein
METKAEPTRTSPGDCACNVDPFADLPPELRPSVKPALGGLRQTTCPGCGIKYWTNRPTDVCVACSKKQLKIKSSTENRRTTMLDIKVLGPGCRNCETLAKKTVDALEAVAAENPAAAEATIEKVTDHNRFVDYGLMFTPGLVINEKLVSSGRVPTMAEIKSWIAESLN